MSYATLFNKQHNNISQNNKRPIFSPQASSANVITNSQGNSKLTNTQNNRDPISDNQPTTEDICNYIDANKDQISAMVASAIASIMASNGGANYQNSSDQSIKSVNSSNQSITSGVSLTSVDLSNVSPSDKAPATFDYQVVKQKINDVIDAASPFVSSSGESIGSLHDMIATGYSDQVAQQVIETMMNSLQINSDLQNTYSLTATGFAATPPQASQGILTFENMLATDNNITNLNSQLAVMIAMFTSVKETAQAISTSQQLSQLQQNLAQVMQSLVGVVNEFSADITDAFNNYVNTAMVNNANSIQNMSFYSSNPVDAYQGLSPGFNGLIPNKNSSGAASATNQNFWGGDGASIANPAFLYFLAQNSLMCTPEYNTSSKQIVQPNSSGFSNSYNSVQSYVASGPSGSIELVQNNPDAFNGSEVYFLVTCGTVSGLPANQNVISLPTNLFNALPPSCVAGVSGASGTETVYYLTPSGNNVMYSSTDVAPGSVAYVSLPQFMNFCTTAINTISIITSVQSSLSLFSSVFGPAATVDSMNGAVGPLAQAAQTESSTTNTYLQLSQQLMQNLSSQLQIIQTIIQNFRTQSIG